MFWIIDFEADKRHRSLLQRILWPYLPGQGCPVRRPPGQSLWLVAGLILYRLIVIALFLVTLPVSFFVWLFFNADYAPAGTITRNDPMWDRTDYRGSGRTPAINSLESMGSGTAND